MILKTQSRKKPNNPFKRLLKQRIILCAFQNSKVRRDKYIFWCVQLICDWLNCFVAKGISCLISSFRVGYVNTRAIDRKFKSKTCLRSESEPFYAKPRCFKHVNMDELPVIYKSQRNAWMNSEILAEWFKKDFVPSVKSHQRSQNIRCPKALLYRHLLIQMSSAAAMVRKPACFFLRTRPPWFSQWIKESCKRWRIDTRENFFRE